MQLNSQHSFIVLAYKDSPYLEDCIKSLLAQTIQSKIIITTSTPSSFIEDIAAKYELEILVNPDESSIASDWNFAYKNSRTQFFTLAHQDDIYLPLYTEEFLNFMIHNLSKKVVILFTGYGELINNKIRLYSMNLIVKSLMLLPFYFKRNISSAKIKKLILSFGNPIPCPAVIYNKTRIKEFEFSGEWQYNLDWYAWLTLAEKEGNFVYLRRKLLLHRLHHDSETSKQIGDNRRVNEEKLIFHKIWGKPMASIISSIYRLAVKGNKV